MSVPALNLRSAATSERQLLADFCETGSQEAFAILVTRHIEMVLGTCQRLLRERSDAEDAVQAVFILLWQRSRQLRGHACVAGWLYSTACNVCRNARRAKSARIFHERQATGGKMTAPLLTGENNESLLTEILDEEIARLSEKLRLPVILFHLEGRSLDEIAAILGAGVPTIGTWLRRAREQLSARLSRRGISIPAAAFSTLLVTHSSEASVVQTLTETTLQTASSYAGVGAFASASVSPTVLSFVKGSTAFTHFLAAKALTLITTVTLLLCGAMVAVFWATPDKEVEFLQGEWRLIAAERDGQATPAANFQAFNERMVITGTTMVQYQTAPDGTEISANKGTIWIDRSTDPISIDIWTFRGTVHGIYARDGDTVTLCVTQGGGIRPDRFQTSKGDERLLKKFKRPTLTSTGNAR